MKIKIKNTAIFRSENSGDQLPGSMATQTSEVPPQLPPGVTEEMMMEQNEKIKSGTDALMIVQLVA